MEQNNELNKVKASPAARRIARELGLDLSSITGTGIDGRIQLEDVQTYHEAAQNSVEPITEQQPTPIEEPQSVEEPQEEEVYEIFRSNEEADDEPESEPIPEVVEEFTVIDAETEEEPESIIVEPIAEQEEAETFANPAEPVFEEEDEPEIDEEIHIADDIQSDDYDEIETECEEDEEDSDYKEFDELDFIPPMPVSISVQVSDEGIISMLEGMQVNLDDELINAVVKCICCALRNSEISAYEDKVNVLELEGKDVYARTAINAHESKISEIEYTDEEFDDVLVNIWNLTDTGLKSFQKTDVDTVHLFVLYNDSVITVDMTCDEYLLDVGECAYFMQMLKKYLQHPSYMLL